MAREMFLVIKKTGRNNTEVARANTLEQLHSKIGEQVGATGDIADPLSFEDDGLLGGFDD